MNRRLGLPLILILLLVIILATRNNNATDDTNTTNTGNVSTIMSGQTTPAWILTGESFITGTTTSNINGSADTRACLDANDESCMLITQWSGNYESYYTAFRTAQFDQMINATGSTLTTADRDAQIAGGFNEVMSITGADGKIWHLVDIGLESQHIYTETASGTIIITDLLGLKGPSFDDRTYINYIDMPQYIMIP